MFLGYGGGRSTTRKMRKQWELTAPLPTDATRQEEEVEEEVEEEEAFQHLRKRKQGQGSWANMAAFNNQWGGISKSYMLWELVPTKISRKIKLP
jgi:hypothetical protein